MLCFGMFERRKFKSCSETNAEVNATGVVYTSSECAATANYEQVIALVDST